MSLREIDGQAGAEGFDPWLRHSFPCSGRKSGALLGRGSNRRIPPSAPVPAGVSDWRRVSIDRALQPHAGTRAPAPRGTTVHGSERPALHADVTRTRARQRHLAARSEQRRVLSRVVSYVSVSGIARLPQVTMPLVSSGGVPVGLSLLAAHGRDAFLLDVVQDVARALETRSA